MRFAIIISILSSLSTAVMGQEAKPSNWSLGGGIGWFHYINTLDVGKGAANTNHAGYTLRLMWEPEHRLSMGIESGYYTVYSIDRTASAQGPGGKASLSAVPLLLSFRMRILPDFYLSAGPGMTIMYSSVTVLDNTASSSFLSLANLHVSAMYRKRINDRFDIGGEFKFLNFGKTEDYGYTLQVVGAYHFRFKK